MTYLAFQYTVGEMPLDEIKDLYISIKNSFPDIPIVAIPSTAALCTLDRDEIQDIIDNLTQFLKENNHD